MAWKSDESLMGLCVNEMLKVMIRGATIQEASRAWAMAD